MKRLWFILVTFPLTVAALFIGWLTLSESGLNWIYLQLRDQPSFSLDAERVGGRLIGPISISELWLEHEGLSLQVDQLKVDFSLWPLLWSRVEINDVQLDGVQLILPPASDGPAAADPAKLALDLALPHIKLQRLQVTGLSVAQGELELPIDSLSATLDVEEQALKIDELEVSAAGHQLALQGHVALSEGIPLDVMLQWRAAVPGQPVVSGDGRLHGDLSRLRLQQAVSSPTQVIVNADVLSPLADLRWNAEVRVVDFRSTQWQLPGMEFAGATQLKASGTLQSARAKGALQATQEISGPLAADFDLQWSGAGPLQIHDLRVASKQSDSRMRAQGWWRPGSDGGEVDVALEWTALRWPLQPDQAVLSPSGKAQLRGGLDDYRFSLSSSSGLAQLPDASLTAQGRGHRDGLRFEQVRLSALQGEMDATGELSWAPSLRWQAQVKARDINPQALQAEWPGRLDFVLAQRGEYQAGQWRAEVEIERAQGELRGYPVQLSGDFAWQDEALKISQAVFKSGDSQVQASGVVNDQLSVQWSIESPRLQELYPAVRGELSASGRLSGTRVQPHVSATLKAAGLVYQNERAERLQGSFDVDIHEPLGISGELRLAGLMLAGQRLDTLHLSGDSAKLSVNAAVDDVRFEAAFAGRLQDDGWQGQLLRSQMAAGETGVWRMQTPARLTVSSDWQVALERSCWGNEDQTSLCVAFAGAAQQWRSELSVSGMPMRLVKPWLPTGMDVDSALDGEASAVFGKGRLSGRAAMRLAAGNISYPLPDEEPESVQHRGATLDMVVDADGVSGVMRLDLGNEDELRAEVQLPGADPLAFDSDKQPLKGTLTARLHQLALLGQQIPEVRGFNGRARLNVKLSGRLRQPSFDGHLSLEDGKLEIPRLGLTVREITVQADSSDLDRVHFRIGALSGEGRLTAQGNARRRDDGEWESEIDINGSNVEVSRIPEARIEASPALKVRVSPYQVDVSGRIVIPYAHLEPRDFTTATRVSPDVVIVGEEQQPVKKWRITSRVQLVLGERVHFNGFGFEGRLNGQVLVEEAPGLPTRASGEIGIVDGRYRAYGQRLAIEQGRLLFSGGPLTSPGVDARAVRKVGNVTAGVRARGQLQRPQVELFSMPAMGQTETLSYLLLGRPLDKASDSDGAMMAQAALALGLTGGDRLARALRDRFGLDEMRVESSDSGDQASLVVGRYLSPRLYVSYGIGLIEAFNTLMVRYSITDRWHLKAESGDAHGADLIYTIER